MTIGYFSNSLDLSNGNRSILCCQWLSEALSWLVLVFVKRRTCLIENLDRDQREVYLYLSREQVSWENSFRNSCVVTGESITSSQGQPNQVRYQNYYLRYYKTKTIELSCTWPERTSLGPGILPTYSVLRYQVLSLSKTFQVNDYYYRQRSTSEYNNRCLASTMPSMKVQ